MSTANRSKSPLSARVKAERERDQVSAMREYQAEQLAVQNRTAKLRALRLAKEAADREAALSAPARKPVRRTKAAKA